LATQDLTPQRKADLGVPVDKGAAVQDVTAGSPSENAGLQVGDVVTAFNGKAITSAAELVNGARATSPGDKVSITYYRGDAKRSATLTVGTRPAAQ
jgi:S1-C subfamily serine protease